MSCVFVIVCTSSLLLLLMPWEGCVVIAAFPGYLTIFYRTPSLKMISCQPVCESWYQS